MFQIVRTRVGAYFDFLEYIEAHISNCFRAYVSVPNNNNNIKREQYIYSRA